MPKSGILKLEANANSPKNHELNLKASPGFFSEIRKYLIPNTNFKIQKLFTSYSDFQIHFRNFPSLRFLFYSKLYTWLFYLYLQILAINSQLILIQLEYTS